MYLYSACAHFEPMVSKLCSANSYRPPTAAGYSLIPLHFHIGWPLRHVFSTPQLLSAQRQPSAIPPRSMRLLVLPVMMAHLQLLFLNLWACRNSRGRGQLSTALPQLMGLEKLPGQRPPLNCSSSDYRLWRNSRRRGRPSTALPQSTGSAESPRSGCRSSTALPQPTGSGESPRGG